MDILQSLPTCILMLSLPLALLQSAPDFASGDDKYRLAVTAFAEQARTELTGYLQFKASEQPRRPSTNNALRYRKRRGQPSATRQRQASSATMWTKAR